MSGNTSEALFRRDDTTTPIRRRRLMLIELTDYIHYTPLGVIFFYKRIQMKSIISIFVALFCISNVYARKEVHLYGTVTDTTGAPLSFTDIVVQNCNLKIMADVNGKYDIKVKRRKKVWFLWSHYVPHKMRARKSGEYNVVLKEPKKE